MDIEKFCEFFTNKKYHTNLPVVLLRHDMYFNFNSTQYSTIVPLYSSVSVLSWSTGTDYAWHVNTCDYLWPIMYSIPTWVRAHSNTASSNTYRDDDRCSLLASFLITSTSNSFNSLFSSPLSLACQLISIDINGWMLQEVSCRCSCFLESYAELCLIPHIILRHWDVVFLGPVVVARSPVGCGWGRFSLS